MLIIEFEILPTTTNSVCITKLKSKGNKSNTNCKKCRKDSYKWIILVYHYA